MGTKPTRRIDAFFEELCVKYGWCLSAAERERVQDAFPDELRAFAECVIETYTRQTPELCGRPERYWVTELAAKWIFDANGVGARSELD